jgi:hypothetical protein
VLFVVTSPVISWAGELEDAQKQVRQNPNSKFLYLWKDQAKLKDKDLLRQVEDEGEKIAIFDCQDSVGGEFSSYAQGVADIFIDIFVRSSQLSLLERSQLKLAMKELEAQKKGKFVVSDDDALNIGDTLGATKIVVCKQTKSRNKLSILARIIDVGTKNIIKSKKSKAPVESYDFLADKVAGLLLEAYTGEDLLDEEEKADIAKMDNFEDLKLAKEKSTVDSKIDVIKAQNAVGMAKVELEKQKLLIEEQNKRQEAERKEREERQGLEFFGTIFQGVLGAGAKN